MEYKLLNENALITATTYIETKDIPLFNTVPSKGTRQYTYEAMSTIILTDGSIEKEYTENSDKSKNDVQDARNTRRNIIERNIILKEANYAIVVTKEKQKININGAAIVINVITNIEIYVKDPKDKKTITTIKDTIKLLKQDVIANSEELTQRKPKNLLIKRKQPTYIKVSHNIYKLGK